MLSKIRQLGLRGLLKTGARMVTELPYRVTETSKYLLHALSDGKYFPWLGYWPLLNNPVLRAPIGMTTREERAFLAWWTEKIFKNKGDIVELGSFVGATTVAIASGLSRNNAVKREHPIMSTYDRHECSPYMAALLNKNGKVNDFGMPFSPGDSSRSLFTYQTEKFRDFFTSFSCDLQYCDPYDRPVEMLFVDVMKTEILAEKIVQKFFPKLLKSSTLIHQDYCHYYTSWIHLIQYELRSLFKFEYHIPKSASVVFSTIGDCSYLRSYSISSKLWSRDKVAAAFDYSSKFVCPPFRENVYAAHVMHYIHSGEFEVAEALFRHYSSRLRRFKHDMRHVLALLSRACERTCERQENKSGFVVDPGNRARH